MAKSKSKSPGFWFYTGDWMKDPELRFCSIFARGLLVDLLCILFEAKERGYASNPDGTPRSDEQIVDAVAGGSRKEKLAALAEIEKSGVLSRDSRGVLYSRRLARLAELGQTRQQSGSKGGSKTKAKRQQGARQRDEQNRGVSDSDSDSVSSLGKQCARAAADPQLANPKAAEREPAAADGEPPGGQRARPGWVHDEWARIVAAWNATERAVPWTLATPPNGFADQAASPGWVESALTAIALLPQCRRFERPVPWTQFVRELDRILAGEFRDPREERRELAAAGGRQQRRGNMR
jgi:hypothetical protein